jgi:hypothetical protein
MTGTIFTIEIQQKLKERQRQATNHFIQLLYTQQILTTKQEDRSQASPNDAKITEEESETEITMVILKRAQAYPITWVKIVLIITNQHILHLLMI